MKSKLLIVCLWFAFAFSNIAFAAQVAPPKELVSQIKILFELLSDGQAVGYEKFVEVQAIKRDKLDEVYLVTFSMEGFGGGNNWQQYFAIFSKNSPDQEESHYTLIDVMHIGGGGWRTIEKLDAKTSSNLVDVVDLGAEHWNEAYIKDEKTKNDLRNGATIRLEALENSGMDSPNFPSKKAVVRLVLKKGRIQEVAP
jgi:hypothetical protein